RTKQSYYTANGYSVFRPNCCSSHSWCCCTYCSITFFRLQPCERIEYGTWKFLCDSNHLFYHCSLCLYQTGEERHLELQEKIIQARIYKRTSLSYKLYGVLLCIEFSGSV